MKKHLSVFLGFLAVMLILNKSAVAQKPISAEDKKAIVALFKDADPTKYKLQFEDGKEAYGRKTIQMSELEQVRKVRNPGGESGYVALIVKDNGVMYVFAATKGKITSLLGEEKAKQLNAIMAKYSR